MSTNGNSYVGVSIFGFVVAVIAAIYVHEASAHPISYAEPFMLVGFVCIWVAVAFFSNAMWQVITSVGGSVSTQIFAFVTVNVVCIIAAALAVFGLHTMTVWEGPGLNGDGILEYDSPEAFWGFLLTWWFGVICAYAFNAMLNIGESVIRRVVRTFKDM